MQDVQQPAHKSRKALESTRQAQIHPADDRAGAPPGDRLLGQGPEGRYGGMLAMAVEA